MRIAYISFEYPPDSCNGGIATYVEQIARTMARRGHEVEVFASSPSRNGRAQRDGVLEHWIREDRREDFGIIAGHVFAARHAEKPFDVLEGPEYNADARRAIELVPDIPFIVKMHTPSLMIARLNAAPGWAPYANNLVGNLRGLASTILRRRRLQPFHLVPPWLVEAWKTDEMEASHARGATLVAPPCEDLCEHARTAWKVPAENIRLAPYPFTPAADFLRLRPRENGSTVGFVGRLERRKGIETFAGAIPSVLKAVPEARFRFIGTPRYHRASGIRYDEWIGRQLPGCMERIEFAGKISLAEMVKAYDSLDICAFPSLWENFPNVCLEAMSAARAVIGSSGGGMREILAGGKAGRLVPPGDSALLAREIISLLQAPAERLRLGEAGRQRILAAYNQSVIGEMMEGIFGEAIRRGRGLSLGNDARAPGKNPSLNVAETYGALDAKC